MVMSWIVAFDPGLSLKPKVEISRGIFVKNYIDQSQEFGLCAVALAYPIITFLRTKRILPAAVLTAIAMSFVVNMAFVVVSRTALVTIPIMLAVFALLHLNWRSIVIILCVTTMFGEWLGKCRLSCARPWRPFRGLPTLQRPEYSHSIGQRLEFWKNRYGSLLRLQSSARHGIDAWAVRAGCRRSVGAAAEIIGNPHNQT